MFFRGARIQRDGQGRCTRRSPRTLPNVHAELPSVAGLAPFGFRMPNSLERTSSEFATTPGRNAEVEESIPVMQAPRGAWLPETLVGSPIAQKRHMTWSVGELPLLVASGSSTVRKPRPRRNATRNHHGRSGVTQEDSRSTAASG